MIAPILCEGINDSWFLHELISKKYKKEPLIYDNKISDFFKDIKKNSDYHRETYSCLILGDNGYQLIDKYFPHTIRDLFGEVKNQYTTNFIILKDNDGVPDETLLSQYTTKIKQILASRNLEKVEINLDIIAHNIIITSTQDNSYSFNFPFIFVSDSLEKQIVTKYLDNNSLKRSKSDIIRNLDPHDGLKYIVEMDEKFESREEIIRHSIINNWFSDELWYNNLCNKIENCQIL